MDTFYTLKSTGEYRHYDDMVFEGVKTSDHLLTAYGCLQDLGRPKESAILFVENIGWRLASEDSEVLEAGRQDVPEMEGPDIQRLRGERRGHPLHERNRRMHEQPPEVDNQGRLRVQELRQVQEEGTPHLQ